MILKEKTTDKIGKFRSNYTELDAPRNSGNRRHNSQANEKENGGILESSLDLLPNDSSVSEGNIRTRTDISSNNKGRC